MIWVLLSLMRLLVLWWSRDCDQASLVGWLVMLGKVGRDELPDLIIFQALRYGYAVIGLEIFVSLSMDIRKMVDMKLMR